MRSLQGIDVIFVARIRTRETTVSETKNVFIVVLDLSQAELIRA